MTGKNVNYFEDDTLALDAEVGAANKGLRTTLLFDSLIEILTFNGHQVIGQYFFPRQVILQNNFHTDLNDKFYEFASL